MIEKRRRKRHGSHIFLITLILTIALGSVVLGCGMIWSVGSVQLVAVKLESQLANFVEDVQAAESVLASAQSAKPVGKYDALLADEALCRQQNIYAKTAASPNETTIVFAGDILFDDHYAVKVKMNQRGRGIEGSMSQEMLDVMRSADIFMVNNEFPYSNRGTPTENKKFTFRAKPEYASYLLDMGADIVSLANNHAYDYGKIAFLDTLDTLNGIGMPYVGAGRNLEEAIQPVYFIVNDQKIAFVAATQIERTENPDTSDAEQSGCISLLECGQTVRGSRKRQTGQRLCDCLYSLGNGSYGSAGLGTEGSGGQNFECRCGSDHRRSSACAAAVRLL